MSFLVIFAAFLMGIAGGFLAMHFISVKGDYVTKSELYEHVDSILRLIKDQTSVISKETDVKVLELDNRMDAFEVKMDEHYRWTMGVWNSFANYKESIENQIPETLQDVARAEVQLSEEDVKPMGPVGEDPKPAKKKKGKK